VRDYTVRIDPVHSYAESVYRWRVFLGGKVPEGVAREVVGEGETHFRHSAVKAAQRCIKRHAKGKPYTDAREFTIRA
jgi:hypothetical protein